MFLSRLFSEKTKNTIDITLISMLWAPSFAFMKIGNQELPPITLVMFRMGLGALFLIFFLKLKGFRIPRDLRLWKHAFILGILSMSVPFVLFSYALLSIPTVLSALMNSATPLITVCLAHFFLKGEQFTFNKAVGTVISIAGFILLLWPKLIAGQFAVEGLGILLNFIAPFGYALGIIYARKYVPEVKPGVMPALQMLTTLIYLIPLSYWIDNSFHLSLFDLSWTTWSSVLALSVLGTSLAFLLYYRIIARQGATALSTAAYIIPLFATIVGVIFLGEELNLNFYISGVLILIGVMLVNNVIKLPWRVKEVLVPLP